MSINTVNRKWLLISACLGWSLVTYLQAAIDSFAVFCICRFLLGAIQAFCNPLAYSILRDLFPPQKRGTTNSIYSSAIYIGNATASLIIIGIKEVGWRQAYEFVSYFGMLVGLSAMVFLEEPQRDRFSVLTLSKNDLVPDSQEKTNAGEVKLN